MGYTHCIIIIFWCIYSMVMYYIYWLVVWTPLKNMSSSNGKDDIPYMKWKIKAMFETTNQYTHRLVYLFDGIWIYRWDMFETSRVYLPVWLLPDLYTRVLHGRSPRSENINHKFISNLRYPISLSWIVLASILPNNSWLEEQVLSRSRFTQNDRMIHSNS